MTDFSFNQFRDDKTALELEFENYINILVKLKIDKLSKKYDCNFKAEYFFNDQNKIELTIKLID